MSTASSPNVTHSASAVPRSRRSVTAGWFLRQLVHERQLCVEPRNLEDSLHSRCTADEAQTESFLRSALTQLEHVAQAGCVHELDLSQVEDDPGRPVVAVLHRFA